MPSLDRQPPPRQRFVVPKGYENRADVLAALAALEVRYGKDNVDFIVEEPPDDNTPPEPPDLSPHRVVRVPADEDE